MPKNNIDRYSLDVSLDLTPQYLNSVFSSANHGNVKRQSRIANELTEKDPAISQAWNVRVSAIAACPWEIVGNKSAEVTEALQEINPSFDSGLIGFGKFLNYLQSAVMHGFSVAQTVYKNAGSVIDGFKVYSQSLFSFNDSTLPYYESAYGQKESPIFYPRWVYHTSTNARQLEPLRSGLVRPLAYLYTFRRHVTIQYMRGIEKYGMPMPHVSVSDNYYEDNSKRQALEAMLQNWTYDGYMISPEGDINLDFPTNQANFEPAIFMDYLNYTEKQIFRLILGQDSTSSADNSNRSTAQVHNLVRQDLLASDAKAVEDTVNNQIIRPLFQANYGTGTTPPRFRFKFKGVSEMVEIANLAKTLNESGLKVDTAELSEKLGMTITEREVRND